MSLPNILSAACPLSAACLLFVWTLPNLETYYSTAWSATAAGEPDTSTLANDTLTYLLIHLDQALHFGGPDGKPVVAPPGAYLVEPLTQGEPRLVFWHEHGTVRLQATRTTHDQRVKTPEAHLIREDDNQDIHHVVVFLPDGMALEATGSVSGIQTRGNFRVTRRYQLDQATESSGLATDNRAAGFRRINRIFPHNIGKDWEARGKLSS